ncbi:dTMP kinase [Mycoplasma struthionis]|uniref:Thymidylate kinase n=1 Tax=Mycoplasma struthionis TaxID=538220 RepID=A0A3G8LHB0_9MOLU|nr:dTMP kinase [Mycoplasma struthionis]AZG68921.1 dTMP kinase [Mycoplasma struthionis]TPI01162.1 dTMP kinase [Mycoplasma struthionis]
MLDKKTGKFIVIEGMDGSGKSTIISMLKDEFVRLKRDDVIFTREPGSAFSKEAEKIRQFILDNENSFSNMVDALLFATSRRLNLEKGIWPALKENKIVISDRYWTSSYVYQGVLGTMGLEKVKILNEIATDNTKPDFIIFFDLDPKTSVQRITQNRDIIDRLETTDVAYYEKLRDAYKLVMQNDDSKYYVIDANCTIVELYEKVVDIFKKHGVL